MAVNLAAVVRDIEELVLSVALSTHILKKSIDYI